MSIRASAGIKLLIMLLASGTADAQTPQPVGTSFRVAGQTLGSHPQVAADAAGNFVVVWSVQESYYYGLRAVLGRRFDSSGTPLGGGFHVGAGGGVNLGYWGARGADVASDPQGNFIVVWHGTEIFAQRYDHNARPIGSRFQVNSYTTGMQWIPAVASDRNGNFMVVWTSNGQDGSFAGVFGQRYDAAGSRLGGEFQVNSYTSFRQWQPDVSSDPEGNFVVVWNSLYQDGAFEGVFGQRYDPSGLPLGEEFQVNTQTSQSEYRPRVASDSSGSFTVVWSSDSGSFQRRPAVNAQRYDATGFPIGTEFQVNTSAINTFGGPDISLSPNRAAVVTWHGDDESAFGVFGQAYDADGSPRGEEFQVSTFTPQGQSYSTVSMRPGGDFAVVWYDTSHGVTGQRFSWRGLELSFAGSCPGFAEITVSNAPPGSEVAIVSAANTSSWTKSGTLCPGAGLSLGEPFQLPPTFLTVDEHGYGVANRIFEPERCWIQALALESCAVSNIVEVPSPGQLAN